MAAVSPIRLLMVTMPWQSLDYASLPLGILRRKALDCRRPPHIDELYANVRWAEFLLAATNEKVTPREYNQIADDGLFFGVGDWVFSSSLYGESAEKTEQFVAFLQSQAIDPGTARLLYPLAPAFVEQLTTEILDAGYDAVGFSSTFMQNVPSLALASALKRARPELITIMGGGNCDGIQGVALHRNFPFLDFVVCGEGERAFVQLIDAIQDSGTFADIPGLCWRDGTEVRVNAAPTAPLPIAEIPTPDYQSFFATMRSSPVREWVEPKIVLEAARGCWWGEKHQCTFCGLNGSFIKFRSKSPDAIWNEIAASVRQFQILDVIMVDNILDMRYMRGLLPKLANCEWDLRIHYEIKSNLQHDDVAKLRQAFITHVQPGIESLSSRVLDLMRKGVTGPRNVQLLRACEELSVTVAWNYLYGFPGETPDDYWAILAQMPALAHLQPPGGASRILLERFSPYFEDPTLGFARRSPASFYGLVYDLPERELADIVYLFDCDPSGIDGKVESQLNAALKSWRDAYPASAFTFRDRGDSVVLRDRRAGLAERDLLLADPREIAIFRALRRDMSVQGVCDEAARDGIEITRDYAHGLLQEWRANHLVFEDAGRFVALPVRDGPMPLRLGVPA